MSKAQRKVRPKGFFFLQLNCLSSQANKALVKLKEIERKIEKSQNIYSDTVAARKRFFSCSSIVDK